MKDTHTFTQVEQLRQARIRCGEIWGVTVEEMEFLMVEYGMQFIEAMGEEQWYVHTTQRSKAFWLFWKYQWLCDDKALATTLYKGKTTYQSLKKSLIQDPTLLKRWMFQRNNIIIV
jgi:hypothetical protein